MNNHLRILALIFPLVMSATPSHSQVVQVAFTVEDNAEERINFSGKLRMLSQRIPSAACHFYRGIDQEGASALLVGATAEFEQILNALEFGDADLNIQSPETRRKTLSAISELRTSWDPLKSAATAIAEGTATSEDVALVLQQNLPVLRHAQLLVEELVKQYANPNATSRAQLMSIDISGRQRMLTQKMSKETCMIGGDYETDTTASDLAGTMGIFEASLDALRLGMETVGIAPPPNSEIAEGLDGVQADWTSVKPYVSQVLAGADLADDDNMLKFQGLNVTMANMNTVVGMYVQSAN